MTAALGLRLTAILIAVAGFIDPVWTRLQPVETPIAIRVLDTPTLDVPTEPGTRRARALRAAEHVRSRLGRAAVVQLVASGSGSVCPVAGVCVLVGDQTIDRSITAGALVAGAIDVSGPLSPNVAVTAVEASPDTSLHGSARLRVHLRGDGISGRSRVEVRDVGVIVGVAEHEWQRRATPADARVDVTWVPLAEGPRRLQVAVIGPADESTTLDNTADVAVAVSAEPWPVLLDEPEVTWIGTFVRRALEGDSRFALRSRAQMAPGISVSRGGLRALTEAALDEARLVIATAPNALGIADVDRLERFVRLRGGSLVLLPDRRPSGPATRLMPPVLDERRDAEPHRIGELLASEIVTFRAGPGDVVLETLDGRPVIISRAMGRGRVIVSGALDGWRYRDGDRFAKYWTSVLADAALAAPAAMHVEVRPSVTAPHQAVHITVARYSVDRLPDELTATATLACGEAREPIRLWPSPQPGVFTGVATAPAAGACTIDAAIAGRDEARAVGRLMVSTGMRPLPGPRPSLADAMAAHGAPVVPAGQEGTLIDRVRELMPDDRAPRDSHPMRSPWWLLPFAACLSGEWWIRRRTGRR